MSSQEKSPDAFRTISEVAEDLDLPQHVLRFWETRFSQIKPLKRGGGRRYYRPDDVELLKGIRHLLYGEGYTIKGVQRILKEQGQRFVTQIWRDDASPLATMATQTEDTQSSAVAQAASLQEEPLPSGVLPENSEETAPPASGGINFLNRLRGEKPTPATVSGSSAVSKEDIRRLQATLFELLECKRTLDQAR